MKAVEAVLGIDRKTRFFSVNTNIIRCQKLKLRALHYSLTFSVESHFIKIFLKCSWFDLIMRTRAEQCSDCPMGVAVK